MYCKTPLNSSEHYVVRQAVKPKGCHSRWKEIGRCCDKCEGEGKPVNIEYKD